MECWCSIVRGTKINIFIFAFYLILASSELCSKVQYHYVIELKRSDGHLFIITIKPVQTQNRTIEASNSQQYKQLQTINLHNKYKYPFPLQAGRMTYCILKLYHVFDYPLVKHNIYVRYLQCASMYRSHESRHQDVYGTRKIRPAQLVENSPNKSQPLSR